MGVYDWAVEQPAAPPMPPITAVGATPYGRAALERELDTLSAAVEGSRNDTLNRVAFNLAQLAHAGHFDWLQVSHRLAAIARERGLTEREIARTLASAFSASATKPRSTAGGVAVTQGMSGAPPAGPMLAPQQTDKGPETPARWLRSVPASSVVPRRLRWLWQSRILLGGLTLLAGREGLGKSTVAVDLTAQITRGVLDGEMYGQPCNVIYVNTEDARDYTIVPRLIAAGADLDRVIFLDVLTAQDQETSIVLPLDTELLAQAVTEHAAALVVLDAATSTIDSRLDGDKDRQMRQGLEAISRKVGEATGTAVLGIVHFGKRESSDTGKLILGSIAWSQVTRSTLAVARDEESGHLVVSATKANLAPDDTPSLAARIVPHDVPTSEGVTSVGKVEWLGETDHDARDLLGAQVVDDRSELDEALEWLTAHLKGQRGRAVAGEVLRAAKRDGIAERTLQRARKKAGVTSRRGTNSWVWELEPLDPEQDANQDDAEQGANTQTAPTSEDDKAPIGTHVHESWRLGALASSKHPSGPLTCPRCQYPAERLVPPDGLCPQCAYPAGGAPDDDTEEDQ